MVLACTPTVHLLRSCASVVAARLVALAAVSVNAELRRLPFRPTL